jgi:hypothetical protein
MNNLPNSFAQIETNYNLNRPSINSNLSNQYESIPNYEIFLGKDCIKKKKCHVFIVLEEEYFNEKDLTSLVNNLKLLNKNREFLRIAIFDDAEVVKDYFNGRREFREIDQDTRGIYSYNLRLNEEYLKAKLSKLSDWKMIFQSKIRNKE